jgi:hypothetical protein
MDRAMPSPEQILAASTMIANRWLPLAVSWHAVIGIVVVLIITRAVTRRAIAAVLAVAMASVSVMAWSVNNPFNGGVFAIMAIGQTWIVTRTPRATLQPAGTALMASGALFTAFGWFYPHFLPDRSPWIYVYAAPMGLLPCPTLAMIAGVALMSGVLETRARALLIGVAALIYGLIGVIVLGVTIDVMLIAAAIVVLVAGLTKPRASIAIAVRPAPRAQGSAPA